MLPENEAVNLNFSPLLTLSAIVLQAVLITRKLCYSVAIETPLENTHEQRR